VREKEIKYHRNK